jgi:CheY-like chemotaxis protein
MKILLIEDEARVRDIIRDAISPLDITLEVAACLVEANLILDSKDQDFDLAICDLKIPTITGAIDEHVDHGLSVLRRMIEIWPGVPIIVLSAFGTVDVVANMLLDARQVDIYGTGTTQPMLKFIQKAKIIDAVAAINDSHTELQKLEQIELFAPSLTDTFRTALRIYARRKGGASVIYRPLAGGRSGARTGLASIRDSSGAHAANIVSKLTTFQRAIEEKLRYTDYISGRLGAATFADLSDEVAAGCGTSAGLFYSVADSFDEDLFALLRKSPQHAASAVEELRSMCSPWLSGAPQTPKNWVDIRRLLISDDDVALVEQDFDLHAIPRDRAIQTKWAVQHGDLHGSNILVNKEHRPVLIDYGRTGLATSVLDPVTLELSALFHPDSSMREESWPSIEALESWDDLDTYLDGCPYPDFIQACRTWSLNASVGRRDLYATVAAFCLRNLQYDDVDKAKALTLHNYASRQVSGT